MTRKEILWNVIYYVCLFTILWLTGRDGPPLRVVFWYHTHRVATKVAYTAGMIGLHAEHTYNTKIREEAL